MPSKLYFRYGTVNSAKTLNLLAVAHNYRAQSKHVILLKPAIDTRFGELDITSRAGLSNLATITVDDNMNVYTKCVEEHTRQHVYCILVDEAQFLSEAHIDQLKHIAVFHNIPVICYGLRTDFKTKLFSGSRRLMEVADTIEEVKTTCQYCNRKAVFSLKFANQQTCVDGPQIELGGDDMYVPTCSFCYLERMPKT